MADKQLLLETFFEILDGDGIDGWEMCSCRAASTMLSSSTTATK